MILTLETRRARKGDCLLLHYGTKTSPKLMLIDAGPAGVYQPQLAPRLDQIRQARQLSPQETLGVDVIMVSHVDDDHIKGILDLTKKLTTQKKDQEPLYLRTRTLWHNSFDDVLKTTPDELTASGFGPASMNAAIDATTDPDELYASKVLASIPQGRTLRDDAAALRKGTSFWKVNDIAGGKLILAATSKKIDIGGGVKVTVVGPLKAEIIALQKAHDKYLKKKKKSGPAAAAALLAAYLDASVANLSSLVLLVEKNQKRILFTGDARGDKILDGLKLTKLLGKKASDTIHVDILKVPHHGSANNVERAFFKKVTADHYVFSGNGEHGNPERETIEMLLAARPNATFTMHFTYPIDEIDVDREKDWKKEQAKEIAKGKPPRPNWNPATHALKPVIDGLDQSRHKVTTLSADATGRVLDLLAPITF
jgi:beta-lactamase superfamily II metal-dependent hydrolase